MQPIRWQSKTLFLLDQTVLPHITQEVACTSALETAAAIQGMQVRGAPAIGVAAAFGMALSAISLPDGITSQEAEQILRDAGTILKAARPTAVNLAWAVQRMLQVAESLSFEPKILVDALETEALQIMTEDIQTNMLIGRHGADLFSKRDCILTYCNTGSLATAGYGTALGVIRSAHAAGREISVMACETRPFLQGARLTAYELKEERIPFVLITDNMAAHFMSQGRIQRVIVGADRIAANGDTANKIGTYALALLARAHDIPFYVAAPFSTIDLTLDDGTQIPIEERPALEVTHIRGIPIAPEGIMVENPSFDVTPATLISAIITEKGVIYPPYGSGMRLV
jgi:methylthioribose-1-phosphate isomerase